MTAAMPETTVVCSECGKQVRAQLLDGNNLHFSGGCSGEHFSQEEVDAIGADLGAKARVGLRHVELTAAREIRSERVRMLWRGRMPLRGITVFAGEKSLGKSTMTNSHLVAKLTRGELEGEFEGTPVDVLIASAEDDFGSVTKPRLMAAGADLDRVHQVQVLDKGGESLLTLPDDVGLLEAEIKRLNDEGRTVGLLVIDPISAFLSGATDSHKDASVRRALAPVADLARRLDIAVAVVAHLTKDEGRRLIHRVSGSGAFVNAARSVLAFARDPDDSEGENGVLRVLVHVASNWGRYAPSLAARIESRLVVVDDGSTADVGYLEVIGETTIGVEDLQRSQLEDSTGTDCEDAIGHALKDGQRPSREVKGEVSAELGCSRKTVERAGMRMHERGDLDVESGGFPRSTSWKLIDPASGDTVVGTSQGTPRVPTRETALQSEIPVPTSPSRDTGDVVSPLGSNGYSADSSKEEIAQAIAEFEEAEREAQEEAT